MNQLNYSKTSWPTDSQVLLLKASILNDESAINAWEKWSTKVDFDTIDPGSYRLIPLLYHNLNRLGIKHSIMDKLKGIYRRTWYENQILSHKALQLLDLFHSAGISTIILKGIALSEVYYKDYGLRPMSDFDVLIPTIHSSKAFNIMKSLGWTPSYKSPEKIISTIHSCDFTDSSKINNVDLHWHLLIECCQPNADDDFWKAARELNIKGTKTHLLDPADQLLHTCVHGIKWSVIPSFRWIADAIKILEVSQQDIVWNRLLIQSGKRKLTYPLKIALEYLKDNFDAPIPSEFLIKLQEVPISYTEKYEFRYKMKNQKNGILGNMPVLWFDSLRQSQNRSMTSKLSDYINYLKRFWDQENLLRLTLYTLYLIKNKLARLIKKNTNSRMLQSRELLV